MEIIYVATGGALGALARYGILRLFQVNLWGTILVNILGSALAVWIIQTCFPDDLLRQRFWLTGFLGAFTTFSAFSVEAIYLIQSGDLLIASLYIFGTLLGCLGVVYFLWQ